MRSILPFGFTVFITVISATGCASPTAHTSAWTSDGKTNKRSNWIEVGPSSIDYLLVVTPEAELMKKLDWTVIGSPKERVTVHAIRDKHGRIVRYEKVSDVELRALRQRQTKLTPSGNR